MNIEPLEFPNASLIGPDLRYNPAMISFGGQTLLAYRTGYYYEGRLYCGRLDHFLRPIVGTFREFSIPCDSFESCEDPRFFVHKDRIHLYFTGCRRATETAVPIIASVGPTFELHEIRPSEYVTRMKREKNWCPFNHADELFATYWMARGIHHVVRIEGCVATPAYETKYMSHWCWGDQRGGTNLVRHEGLLWGFFHSSKHTRVGVVYYMGGYAIEASPPFRIVKMTKQPLYFPTESAMIGDREGPRSPKQVIFPSGLVFEDDHWIIAAGYNDHKIVLFRIAHRHLVNLMGNVELPTSPGGGAPPPLLSHDPPAVSLRRLRRSIRLPQDGTLT